MQIEEVIEKIYSGKLLLSDEADIDVTDPTNPQKIIWNYNRLDKERLLRAKSRYHDGFDSGYCPYEITSKVFYNLYSKINLANWYGSSKSNEILSINNNYVTLYNIPLRSLPIYKGDITPAGLFLIRLGSAGGNKELYDKVYSQLIQFLTPIKFYNKLYWIPSEIYEEVNSSTKLRDFVVKCCKFKWDL